MRTFSWVAIFFITAVILCTCNVQAQSPVDLTGYWQLNWADGRTGYIILNKTGTDATSNNPSYVGKLSVQGFGEHKVFGNQVLSYFIPGNDVFFAIDDVHSTKFILFTVTGSGTMPGRFIGTGWSEGIPGYLQGDLTATRH